MKKKFLKIVSEGLGRCKKVKVSFPLKENVTLIFRPKRRAPFTTENVISKELEDLEKK